ncbi:hypothetical protein R1sor_012588 [Riccia sorocarpa]|uniref:RRM domain-containing protein n=1 Tax=Riccia sorocarpa TaxID=122646 RepID=A0ABD3I6V1_9MARC
MGDKAAGGSAEGASIFETLFGGFSNGLSIFTNNPFRRKQEIPVAKADSIHLAENRSQANKLETGEKDTNGKKTQEVANGVSSHKTPTESETDSKSQRNSKPKHSSDGSGVQGEGGIEVDGGGRMKKVKRGEDDGSEKKKRKKTSLLSENAEQDGNVGSVDTASVERRKRKQGESAEEESVKNEGEQAESDEANQSRKSEKRRKRKAEENLNEDTQTEEPVKRQVERQRKKRLNELIVEGQEDGKSDDSGEKRKKKMKLVNELNESSPRVTETTGRPKEGEQVASKGKSGRTKRKPDDELERGYEKKLRESTDSKGDGRAEGDMDASESKPKGKRKVVEDDDEDFLGGKGKKRKLTKQQRIDNEDKLKRTIFVGNIPVDVKAKNLITEFSQFGAVESARLRSVPLVDVKMPRRAAVITGNVNENRSSLNGYVVFKEESSAKAALAHNMKEFRGKHLRVDLAIHGSSGVEYDRKRSIFVGNLPFDAEEEELITLFQGNMPELEVEAVRVVRDPKTSAGKGIAFVCFKTKAGAEAALDKREFIMFKNRHLRLERLGSKATSLKKTPAPPKTGEPKPADGAERRISARRAPAPYEGERAGKRKGMTLRSSVPEKTGRRVGLHKRPAVAAKKARALQMKSGGGSKSGSSVSGGKKRKEDRGKKGKVQPRKLSRK